MSATPFLIGVDGGATEVKAYEVVVLAPGEYWSLGLGTASASCCYDRLEAFEPVPLARQQTEADAPVRDELERAQADLWIDAIADTIASVASDAGSAPIKIGMCMPGVKTADARGVAMMRNGPRIPDLLDRLESRLADMRVRVERPIAALVADGDACAVGESVDAHGLLRDVANAYYIGGGTGLAEGFRLDGAPVKLDALRGRVRKAWELVTDDGRSFDQVASMGGMNASYSARSGRPLALEEAEFPEQRALHGDALALEVVDEATRALAHLIHRRMRVLAAGAPFEDGRASRPATYLERVVLGQRLGRMYAEPALRRLLRERVETVLAELIVAARDEKARAAYLVDGGLRPGLVCASTLRAAPALGAVALALHGTRKDRRDARDARSARG